MEVNANSIRKIGKTGDDSWLLKDTRQITFFIGPNNSGKSRELRKLFNENVKQWALEYEGFEIKGIIEKLESDFHQGSWRGDLRRLRSLNYQQLLNKVLSIQNKPICLSKLAAEIYSISKAPNYTSPSEEHTFFEIINSMLKGYFPEKALEKVSSYSVTKEWGKIYVPTLRGLRHVAEKDIFESRTRSDYFASLKKDEYEIFTGHSLYKDLISHLLGSYEKRQKVRDYEQYLSENFFFGRDISLVPMVNKDVVHVKEGDDEDRPIYDLGDGIQSIILLTYKVFMAEEPTMFFIEEPEHFLHAGLQRTLIETFAKHKEHMFFMTTHSNHFLDLAQERDDISIQQVLRVKGESRVRASLDYGELLNGLGVRASSVLLANCSIWVEGVTDKLYPPVSG